MAEHYLRYHLRLTDADAAKLDAAVKRSGLSRAAYMRTLINNLIPMDKPSPDYLLMMRELHAIVNSLNRIAQRAHLTDSINANDYNQIVAELRIAITKISEAVYTHRRLD